MHGYCKLCNRHSDLKLSHIVPSFIGKWLKKTSITGYLRNNVTYKKRSQDIWKEYWLCNDCESLFSKWENEFASKVFYPFVDKGETFVEYDNWLSKFSASLSWRTLKYMRSKNSESHQSSDYINLLNKKEEHLSGYLLGISDDLSKCQQHLIPLERINSVTGYNIPENINRYFLRNLSMDIIQNDENIFIYTKIPQFIVLGLIKAKNPALMKQSLISVNSNKIYPKDYYLPDGFSDYIFDKANEIKECYKNIPVAQQDRLEKYIIENPEFVFSSKSIEAFFADVALFQDRAFRD